MYIYHKYLENVYRYQAKKGNLVYQIKEPITLYLNESFLTDDVKTFVFNGESLVYSTKECAIIKVDIKKIVSITLLDNHSLGESLISDTEISVIDKISNTRLLYDFYKGELISKLPRPVSLKIKSHVFFRKFPDPIVECLSLETGEYLWQTDISTYVSSLDGFSYKDERIGGILGVSDNKLIIRVGTRLLMIDLQNGIITGDTEALSHEKNYSVGPAGFHSYLHLEGEYVYLLKRDRYLRINLITGELETLWINSQSDLIIEHVHYDENYAYFMACIGWNLQPEVLGVFDRKNLAIIWQYDQPIYSSQPPQSDGKKLYSLDTGGTLHVFERAI